MVVVIAAVVLHLVIAITVILLLVVVVVVLVAAAAGVLLGAVAPQDNLRHQSHAIAQQLMDVLWQFPFAPITEQEFSDVCLHRIQSPGVALVLVGVADHAWRAGRAAAEDRCRDD